MIRVLPLLVVGVLNSVAGATVATGAVFGNHMVLQRGGPVPVFGTATAGEKITVGFNGQTKSVVASGSGAWSVKLDAMAAGGPYTMTIKGSNTLTYTDVMVGEVWHCAGQSNMDTRMAYSEYSFADEIKNANYPKLRYLTMRQSNQTVQWQQVNPASVASMTATGYFFGKRLLENLDGVAVGILNTSVGGTVIKTWLDPATVSATADLKGDVEAGGMYKSWIKPVEGFGIRGTVYLQGENDASSSALTPAYNLRLEALIKGWRKTWSMPNMPFLVVGLCHKGGLQGAAGETSNQASVREAQRQVTDTMPNSILSVTVDLGSTTTWHYPQKPQLGARLGDLARGWIYGQTGFPFLSPRPTGCYFRGSTIVVPWDARGGKLALSSGNVPTGFAVAGQDGIWSWATASLKGDTVFLTTSVLRPMQIRYAWGNNPVMNLSSTQGLPATPFRSNIASTSPTSVGRDVCMSRMKGLRVADRMLVVAATGEIADISVVDATGRIVACARDVDLASGYRLRIEGSGVLQVIVKVRGRSIRTERIVVP